MVRKRASAPTMKDVAREAGVSLGTVSKVINGIAVGEGYRCRVEAAISRLGYTVNNYARGLKTNRTDSVALVLPSLRHPFFAAMADEVTACLARQGRRCVLMITNFDARTERESFIMVRQNKVDGVIALTYSPNIEADESLPIVTIDRHFGPGIPCVSSDNYLGGQMAAEKLLELGCKRLLCLQIGAEIPGEPHKRSAGFENVCAERRAVWEKLLLKDADTEEPFRRFLDEHIHGGRLDFDGVFCSSDGLVVRMLNHLKTRGIRSPEDVQFIGYDGITDFYTGDYLCSTIVQPLSQMAETAVRLLDDGDLSAGASICLPVRYQSGGTTKD